MTEKNLKKVLVADPSSTSIREIFNSSKAKEYEIKTVDNGPDCMNTLQSFQPDIVVVELLLPQMHGIEILTKIKTAPETRNIGVIVVSSLTMIQNYNAAIELGANYFLTKPFSNHDFFLLLERFYEGTLTPDPFSPKMPHFDEAMCYNPIASTATSYIKFWGTRGSSPVSGNEYIQYGGNTCCLEIRHNDSRIVIDAGTGIRDLGDDPSLNEQTTIPLLIGHTHWDHITGFPFFAPLYRKDCHLDILAPVGYEKNTKELFNDMLAFGYFPVRLEEMFAKMTFNELRDGGSVKFGDIEIFCHHANHPGPTLCFKIKSPRKTIGYVSDNEVLLGFHGPPGNIGKEHHLLEPHLSLLNFLEDCHVLIHEAQYFPYEYHEKVGWGHSSISNATAFVKHLNCHEWIVTHHDPKHTDEILKKKEQIHIDVLGECNMDIRFKLAHDGLVVPL